MWRRPRPAVAGAYRSWLIDRGSLTARISRRCGGMQVHVVFQGLRRADRDERFLFTSRGRVLVREVLLYCRGTPVVFAHTVVAQDDLRGAWRSIATLGARPLGAALFADPRVSRYALHQRKIGVHHELRRRIDALLSGTPPTLWARRSLFRL